MPAKNKPTPKASTPSRGASPAAVQAFVASNPNSRTAQAAAPTPTPTPRATAPVTVQTNAGENPMGVPAKVKPPTVMQGLKIAGTGGITKQELNTITDASGKSGAQVIQRLDDLNRNLREKDQVGINLNSGAANMLIREASKAAPSYDNFLGLGQSAFGPGKIGSTLQSRVGSLSTGGYINPLSGQQSMTPAIARSLLPGGLDLMPSGRETVRGIGKQYQVPERFMPKTDADAEDTTNTVNGTDGTDGIDPTIPIEPEKEEEKQDININMPGSPFDLASWATSYRAARSSRKRAGRQAQGIGSKRVAPRSNVLGM